MAGTPYPKEPMNRFAYTKLSEVQIAGKLRPAIASGPASVLSPSDIFSGKKITIVTDKGLTLAYSFAGPNRLAMVENGGGSVQAGYNALALDDIAFFTHLIPDTQRGYAVVIDRKTSLATVFEIWFSGYKDNREVQREIYHGYAAQPDGAAPAARHVPTNRVEGKAFYWKQDSGAETLEYYPSAAYSHFVELTRQGGELGFCGPSDYIRISNDLYIYTRTECEFSGTFTLYVMDLNRVEQIGVRIGFDASDDLEYYVFRGHGEWLGQIAQFEKFGDISVNPVPKPSAAKGARRVYRPLQTMEKLTKSEVAAAVSKSSRVFQARPRTRSGASGMATNGASPSAALVGRAFTLSYDNGPVIDYLFDSADTMRWRYQGRSRWTKARYQAWESMPGVFIFGHLLAGAANYDGHMIVIDLDHGLVTCFNGYLNTPYIANEAGAKTLFGVIEAKGLTPPKFRRHERTRDLLGSALTWNYAPGLTSMHLYSTPHTVSWIIFTESGAGGMEWSGSGDFVKIRDGLYFVYWLEEACNGTLGTILINMRTMHDAGIGYHCGKEGLNMSQIGAHSRNAGQFDIEKYYQIKTEGSAA